MISSLFVSYLACQTIIFNADVHSGSYPSNVMVVDYPFEQDVKYSFSIELDNREDPTRWLSALVLDLDRDTHFNLEHLHFPQATHNYGMRYVPRTERYSPTIYLQGTANGTLTVCACESWW